MMGNRMRDSHRLLRRTNTCTPLLSMFHSLIDSLVEVVSELRHLLLVKRRRSQGLLVECLLCLLVDVHCLLLEVSMGDPSVLEGPRNGAALHVGGLLLDLVGPPEFAIDAQELLVNVPEDTVALEVGEVGQLATGLVSELLAVGALDFVL